MKLYLMRHGEAATKEDDPERGLTPQGRRAIENLAKKLATKFSHQAASSQTTGQGMNFEQVYHSGKTRAQQTAEIIAKIIAPEATPRYHDNLKPNDNPENLLKDIETWTKDTLITSHLPFIPSLLALLTKDRQAIRFDPGTIVCLNKQGSNWRLEWVDRPEE